MTAPFQVATLEATLERITYANEDTGYIVAKVDTGRGGELVTVVGSLLGARPGEALRLRGKWGRIRSTAGSSRWRTSAPCSRRRCRVSAGIWGRG